MTPAQGHLPPAPSTVSAFACQAQLPPAGLGAGGGVSLPIPAAQLPAVLILTALRVIHLVHAETFLEVLGPNLGIQDLLSHVAGEPASLLVVQTLTKDPPCTGRGRVRSSYRGLAEPSCWHRSPVGLPRGACSESPCRRPSDWGCLHILGRHRLDTLLGSTVCGHRCDGTS